MTCASTPVADAARPGVQSATAVAQFVESGRVPGDPVVVREPVADDDVHHRQHHRDVGAREGLDEAIAA
jgi:hypothetical protein